jgi:hypothetical protein
MATTTMNNTRADNLAANKIFYWTLAIIAAVAVLLFFSMRTPNYSTAPVDTTVPAETPSAPPTPPPVQ